MAKILVIDDEQGIRDLLDTLLSRKGYDVGSWNPQSFVNHSFSPALAKAGIQGVCWHTLRHTAASRRVMAGVDLVAVKEILGHRDIQTTLRYAHLAPGHLREAVNRGSVMTHGLINSRQPLERKELIKG